MISFKKAKKDEKKHRHNISVFLLCRCHSRSGREWRQYVFYGWNKVSGVKTTLFTPGNWWAVFSITFRKIIIRADPPSVNHGTSENSSVNVPSTAKSAESNLNFALGNSVMNHLVLSIAVRFHLINSLIVSRRRFLLAGNIR